MTRSESEQLVNEMEGFITTLILINNLRMQGQETPDSVEVSMNYQRESLATTLRILFSDAEDD